MGRPPKAFESTTHHEERSAQMHAEYIEKQIAEQEELTRVAENKEIEVFQRTNALPKDGETREQLLERIRQMREYDAKLKNGEIETPVYRTESLQKAFEAEQEAGRVAVARAQAEMERNQAIAERAAREAAGEKKAG